jgi:malate dehydrogenase (oxaloacetate-decarboxylating)(NADP+)
MSKAGDNKYENNPIYDESRDYHSSYPKGKISIHATKACRTQKDLSLAYTPGVAAVSLDIRDNPDLSWEYTNRPNTVAVISDGTAVLGLGNIGAEAAMPVMEGKSVLFKQFADIDAMPLCLDITKTPDINQYVEDLAAKIASLEPTFGAINLEDIKAPECFLLQEKLRKIMKIPVFHDDQDGTAVIIAAGIENSLQITGKLLSSSKVVISGAGAAGIACARLFVAKGLPRQNIFLCDSKGLVARDRELHDSKKQFAVHPKTIQLRDCIQDADVFIGVSTAGILSKDMVCSMAEKSIVFAVANPVPEIMPEDAKNAGAYIVGSGRSDFDNQVNNSLGFPGIFRGLLDSRASNVNEAMMMSASSAIASLVQEPVHGIVKQRLVEAYPEDASRGMFDKDKPLSSDYVIPKQFDLRVVPRVARAIAESATKSGLARVKINDFDQYEKDLLDRILKLW